MTPEEDELLRTMQSHVEANEWTARSYIFDELLFAAASPQWVVEESFEELTQKCGHQFKLSQPTTIAPLALFLLFSGRGQRGRHLPRAAGNLQFLYDSIIALRPGSAQACPPDGEEGPYTVRAYNNWWAHGSQREDTVLCLEALPEAPTEDTLYHYGELICWQPHTKDFGHFFATT